MAARRWFTQILEHEIGLVGALQLGRRHEVPVAAHVPADARADRRIPRRVVPRGCGIILFTLDAGPAWWFHDSPEGMRRFRERTMETAGFYNTVGFNDDTRAFLSIPARHDVARHVDAAYLAGWWHSGNRLLYSVQR